MIGLNIAVILFMALGIVSFLGGAVGIIRMPDFYSRLHPVGKLDTLGIMAMGTGIALYNLGPFSWEALLVSMKIMLIVFFVFLSSPTATHSIVDAGIRAGLKPWSKSRKD